MNDRSASALGTPPTMLRRHRQSSTSTSLPTSAAVTPSSHASTLTLLTSSTSMSTATNVTGLRRLSTGPASVSPPSLLATASSMTSTVTSMSTSTSIGSVHTLQKHTRLQPLESPAVIAETGGRGREGVLLSPVSSLSSTACQNPTEVTIGNGTGGTSLVGKSRQTAQNASATAAVASPASSVTTISAASGVNGGNGNGNTNGGNFHVAIRVRPLTDREVAAKMTDAWIIQRPCWDSDRGCVSSFAHASTVAQTSLPGETDGTLNGENSRQSEDGAVAFPSPVIAQVDPVSREWISGCVYPFDHIFDAKATTRQVYDAIAKSIISSAMAGVNGTIFASGQTSSGKTHTMIGSDGEPGIISLAIQDIYRHIEMSRDSQYTIKVSYMEIYNEVIKDLLEPANTNLKIHETLNKEIYVGKLTEEQVQSAEHVHQLMKRGEDNRHFGETNMNDRSSRSHSVFHMIIERRSKDPSFMGVSTISHLNLVDLAGSERISSTGAEGIRLKEGSHINKSLLMLGNCISKLAEGNSFGHIPYRDSKLTRILQTSLGGNGLTGVICTVTPASALVDETNSTLKFASRAKRITTVAHINEVISDEALIKKLRKDISQLQKQLAFFKNPSSQKLAAESKVDMTELQTELQAATEAKTVLETDVARLQIMLNQQTKECENMRSQYLQTTRELASQRHAADQLSLVLLENEQLKNQIAEMRHSTSALENERERIMTEFNEIEANRGLFMEELETYRSQKDAWARKDEHLKEQLFHLQQKIDSLTLENERLQTRHQEELSLNAESLRNESLSLQSKIQNLEKVVAEREQELEIASVQAKEEIQALKDELTSRAAEKLCLQKQIDTTSDENLALRSDKASSEKERSWMKDELLKLRQDNEFLKSSETMLKDTVVNLERFVEEQTLQLEEASHLAKEKSHSLSLVETRVQELATKNIALESAFSELKIEAQSATSKFEAQLEAEIVRNENAVQTLQLRNKELKDQLQERERAVLESKRAADRLHAECARLTKEISFHNQSVSEKNSAMAEAQQLIAKVTAENDALSLLMSELKDETASANASVEAKEQQLRSAEQALLDSREKLQDKLYTLMQCVSSQKEKHEHCVQDISSALAEMRVSFESQQQQVQTQLEPYFNQMLDLASQNESLRELLQAKETFIERGRAEMDRLKLIIDQVESELEESEAKAADTSQSWKEKCHQLEKTVEQITQEKVNAEKKLQDLTTRGKAVMQKMRQLQEESDSLSATEKLLQQELDQCKESLTTAEMKCSQLMTLETALQNELTHSAAEIGNLRVSLENSLKSHEDYVQTVASEKASLRETLDSLESQLASMSNEEVSLKALRQQNQALDETVAELRIQLQEAQSQMSSLQKQIGDLNAVISSHADERDTAERSRLDMQQKLSQLTTDNEALEKLLQEMVESEELLQAAIIKLREENASLSDRLNEFSHRSANITEPEAAQIDTQKETADQALIELRQKLQERESELLLLKDALSKAVDDAAIQSRKASESAVTPETQKGSNQPEDENTNPKQSPTKTESSGRMSPPRQNQSRPALRRAEVRLADRQSAQRQKDGECNQQ